MLQAHVPHAEGVSEWSDASRAALRSAAGHCPGGRQALPLRLPPLLVAGGGQGRPPGARQALHAPRLALHGRPTQEAGRLVREGQTHQQRNGQEWTGQFTKFYILYLKQNHPTP